MDEWHGDPVERNNGKNVTCVPMQRLLDMTGVLDIELFSLDVEGAEFEVLQTINFEVTNIRVVVIELDEHDPVKNANVRQHMRKNGFITSKQASLGTIQDACNVTTYGHYWSCMRNEVFINPRYKERKDERAKHFSFQRYYINGTGVACPEQ